jgi:hypothetical protein
MVDCRRWLNDAGPGAYVEAVCKRVCKPITPDYQLQAHFVEPPQCSGAGRTAGVTPTDPPHLQGFLVIML